MGYQADLAAERFWSAAEIWSSEALRIGAGCRRLGHEARDVEVGVLGHRGQEQRALRHVLADGLRQRDAGEQHPVVRGDLRDERLLQVHVGGGHVEAGARAHLELAAGEIELPLVRRHRLVGDGHERLGGEHGVVGGPDIQLHRVPGGVHAGPGRALLVTGGQVGPQRPSEVPERLVERDGRVVGVVERRRRTCAETAGRPPGLGPRRSAGEEAGSGDPHLPPGLHDRRLCLGQLGIGPRQIQRLLERERGGRRSLRLGRRRGRGLGGRHGECEEQRVHSNLRAVMGSSREALWAG